MLDLVLWSVVAVAALTNWVAVARDDQRTERWSKPLTLIALIAVAVALDATASTHGRWLLVALTFGLLGDVFLLGKSVRRFQLGLAAFLVGHLAYVVSFLTWRTPGPIWAWGVLAVLALCVIATKDVAPSVHRTDGYSVSIPVLAYTLVIGAMAVAAWWTGDPVVALGATIFVVSDVILSVDRFVRPIPHGGLLVMVNYHLGQILIVAGMLLL